MICGDDKVASGYIFYSSDLCSKYELKNPMKGEIKTKLRKFNHSAVIDPKDV